jgi:hypothetical protein
MALCCIAHLSIECTVAVKIELRNLEYICEEVSGGISRTASSCLVDIDQGGVGGNLVCSSNGLRKRHRRCWCAIGWR